HDRAAGPRLPQTVPAFYISLPLSAFQAVSTFAPARPPSSLCICPDRPASLPSSWAQRRRKYRSLSNRRHGRWCPRNSPSPDYHSPNLRSGRTVSLGLLEWLAYRSTHIAPYSDFAEKYDHRLQPAHHAYPFEPLGYEPHSGNQSPAGVNPPH